MGAAKCLLGLVVVLFLLVVTFIVLFVLALIHKLPYSLYVGSNCPNELEGTEISEDVFGYASDGQEVRRYTMTRGGVEVSVMTLGAAITSIKAPGTGGEAGEITLGFDTVAEYENDTGAHIGRTIGRYANRIKRGSFYIDGNEVILDKNNGPNTLHGGTKGFDKYVWEAEVVGSTVVFSLTSRDGDMGFPGDVMVKATYALQGDSPELLITYEAESTEQTPINLCNHAYFNLMADQETTVYNHQLQVVSSLFLEVDSELIPTGTFLSVTNPNQAVYNLQALTDLGSKLQDTEGFGGYDNTYVLKGVSGKRLAARLEHRAADRGLAVYTDQPGLQVYTANGLQARGRGGANYTAHGAVCLETQNYPDAPNHDNEPSFPDSILSRGNLYIHRVWLQFYRLSRDRL